MRKFDKHKGKASDIIDWIRKEAWKNPNIKPNVFYSVTEPNWDRSPLDPFLPYLNELSPQLKADLSKVKFDWENYTSFTSFSDISWYDDKDQDYYGFSKDIMGPHNRIDKDEVSWIGCAAGGDWEVPIFFMLYMDQGKVRAWIPKEGNCWNRTTKEAFGNDDDDSADIKKQLKAIGSPLHDEDDDMMYEYIDHLKDSKKILQGIKDHFKSR